MYLHLFLVRMIFLFVTLSHNHVYLLFISGQVFSFHLVLFSLCLFLCFSLIYYTYLNSHQYWLDLFVYFVEDVFVLTILINIFSLLSHFWFFVFSQRADASTIWKEFATPDGRRCVLNLKCCYSRHKFGCFYGLLNVLSINVNCRYYYNKETKQSKWTIPEELKVCTRFMVHMILQLPNFWH